MTSPRAMALTVFSAQQPAVADGKPVMPKYWAKLGSSVTKIVGPAHIHAIKDPDPIWNPYTGGWSTPPPPAPHMVGHWSARSLPDPSGFPGGYYWLGVRTAVDGSGGLPSSCSRWFPYPDTPSAPAWSSFFPFKPSVRAHDSYLPNGGTVHHPKGVHFNSHFIEHMWMDWGRTMRQPFTWIMAAMPIGYPSVHYIHHLLDSGINPDSAGIPRLTAADCNTPRGINDNQGYRTMMTVSASQQAMRTSNGAGDAGSLIQRSHAAERPRMFFGVYNGNASRIGSYDIGGKRSAAGRVTNGAAQTHRYYVMGRRESYLSQEKASHILVLELRYWNTVLTTAELDAQYKQIASTHQFSKYRSL